MADTDRNGASLTDTGSLQPSAEALDWQRRADAWAQQSESDPHQSVEPANRWSDVAATGRPTFPADGVGWRTETAEWRAAGARWRQTTEWRSTTGSHVWRSTTEAWQSGDNESYPPESETPMAQPALSSSAWSGDASADTRPAWQQFTDSPAEPESSSRSAAPSWQQPSPRVPAESSPSWQQLVEPGQQQSWNSRPSWQRDAIEGSATWTDSTEQRAADTGTTWLRTEDPRDDGRHLVREDDRAAWRRDAGGGSPPVGRRRAPEPGSAPSGGTGWSSGRSESEPGENTDNWARHTDTGGIQLYGDMPAPPSAWGTGTGFGSRNVNRREESGRAASYGDTPGYEMPPATPYEPPPRQPRREDTARSFPAGGYDDRPRYSPEGEQPRYADESPRYADESPRYADDSPTGRSRRSRRHADEADAPRRGDTGSFTPPEPRSARRSRAESDETATFSAVPMPAPPPSSAQRSAVPMPVPPPSNPPRSAMPAPPATSPRSAMPAPPASSPRSAMPAPPPSSAPRSAMPAAPASAPTGSPSKGRAKYNAGGADWRDQTGSWEAEPDTSSWVRDPDTGQWSRSNDDPRILAWRREAARREAMGEGPRALPPPPPASDEPEARQTDQPPTGWRNTPPPLPAGPAPRSATPYGGGAASARDDGYGAGDSYGYGGSPASPAPGRDPYDQPQAYGAAQANPASGRDDDRSREYGTAGAEPRGYGSAPTSSVPGRDAYGYGSAPSSSAPSRDRYDEPTSYGGTRSAPGRDSYDEPRSYGSAPSSSIPGRDPYGSYGGAPTSSAPARDRYDEPTSYGSARTTPASSAPYGDEPRGSGSAPTSSAPGREPYGTPPSTGTYGTAPARDRYDEPTSYGGAITAPSSSIPAGDRYDEPTGYGGARSAPASSVPYGEPRGYGSAPTSSAPGRDQYDDYGSASTSSLPRRAYQNEPGNAPRSGTAYGSSATAPYRDQPALPSAPRSAPGYGGSGDTPGYSGSSPVSSPRGYSGARALPPGSAAAPASGVPQYIPLEEPQRSDRRRADDDPSTGRRGTVEPTAYADEPLSPEAWQTGRTARPDAPSWSLDSPTGTTARPGGPAWSLDSPTGTDARSDDPAGPDALSETGQWHLDERRERARGSATYREGGGSDWRRDLADQSDLAEGESRRFGTSDYVPFRAGGSAAVQGQSNLSSTSTSLISPVAREAAAAPQRGAASWNGPSGAYERRPVTSGYPTGRKSDLLDPDDEEDEQGSGGPLAAVGYTVIWYGVPVVLFIAYMLVVGAGAQGHAFGTLAKAAPQFLVSLVLSVLVAIGLRFVSHSWKAISVGLAAAVVGGGLATVLTSAITGNSLS